ncbi:MAG: hypothetical protein NTW86_04185 [Candidatus Sumerlaeota bacterium]|nr:hypothetical protein [Candidatus Sumerlaeota bacterium]
MNRKRIETVLLLALSLFAVGASAQTVTLNRPLGDFEGVGLIGVTSDGQTAVYHVTYADPELDPWFAKEWVYTVPVGGGASKQVFTETGEILEAHVLTPDGFLVTRLSSHDEWGGTYHLDRLVSVNLATGASTDLNSGVPGEEDDLSDCYVMEADRENNLVVDTTDHLKERLRIQADDCINDLGDVSFDYGLMDHEWIKPD